MTNRRRREVLQTLGAVGIPGLASCLGDGTEAPNGTPRGTTTSTDARDSSTESPSSTDATGAGRWPMFQFDSANTGHNPEATGPSAGVTERWVVELGDTGIRSSPAVRDETVFVAEGTRLHARGLSDGGELWSVSVDGAVDASPTVAGDLVVFISDPGTIYAADVSTGRIRWQTDTNEPIPSETPRTNSPTVVDESVYVGLYRGGVGAFDLETGTEQWRRELDGAVIGSAPAVVDGVLYTGHTGGELVAIHVDDGTIKWRTPLADFVTCPPAVSNGQVYVGASDGQVHEVAATDGDVTRTFETEFDPELPGGPMRKINASPAIAGDTLVVGSNDYHAYAWNLETGERQWRVRVGGRCYTSPAVTENAVHVGGISRVIHRLNLTTGGKVWSFEPEGEIRDSSPAVADDTLTFGDSTGRLYALEAADT